MTVERTAPDVVYIIVGMHRSGTSSIGRLMENIGFDFGDNLLEGIDSINDRGFWEDRDVVALNEHIFELYGSNWFDFERLPGKWWEDAKIKDLIGIAETWFYEGFSHEKPIAVKDPRFCRLLPFWKRVFIGMGIHPHIIFVIRHPAEVAASLKRRDGFSLQVGYLLWLSYVIDGLYYSRNLELSIIDFETLLTNPEKLVGRLVKADIASMHGLSEGELTELVKNTLDLKSRHQKSTEVLISGEVQGDVQLMAHELYEVLLEAKPDEAKAIADKYRKRFYRLLDHHKEVLSALQATVKKQVEANQKLTEIGSGHSHALAVIHDKDIQLEENKEFIAKCLAEIGSKESQLAITQQELERNQARVSEQEILNQKNSVLWDRLEELQQVTHGRELKLSESLAYIEKCEAWIGELNLLSEDCQRILAEQRDYIARCEARISEQDQWLNDNTVYIAKCETRIKEQDYGLAENRDYILKCEARIREQDNGLQIRDQMLGERLEKINRLELHVKDIEILFGEKQNEFSRNSEEILQIRSHIEVLDKKLQMQNDQLQTNQKYIQQCEEYIAEQDRALDDFGTKMSELQSRAASFDGDFSAQGALLEKTRTDLMATQKQLADRDIRIADLELTFSAQSTALEKTRTDLMATQKQLTDRDIRIADLELTFSEQSTALEKTRTDLIATQKQLADRDVRIADLELTLSGQNAVLEKTDNELSNTRNMLAARDADISRLHAEQENNAAELSRMQQLDALNKQRIVIQKKQIDSTKVHAAALESELVAINAQISNTQQELERYRSYRVVKLIDKFLDAG